MVECRVFLHLSLSPSLITQEGGISSHFLCVLDLYIFNGNGNWLYECDSCFQLEHLYDELTLCAEIPTPSHWTEEPRHHLPCATLSQRLHHQILDRLGRPPPHLSYERRQMKEVLAGVWSSLKTLFLARQQLELVALMRKTVINTTNAIQQVWISHSNAQSIIFTVWSI